jgi:nicotinamide-nucleotide amidase
MHIELLTIGTELLLGQKVDTNSAEIGVALAAVGVPVIRRTSVPDDPGAIGEAARQALARTGAFIATGGLGPTADDVTKHVVADIFGMPLEFHSDIWDTIVARFARFGRVPSEKNRSQAEVPRGASVLANRWGTAPGLWLEGDAGLAILLPGVPSEMRALLTHEVLPRLTPRGTGLVVRSRTVRTTGVPESSLAERLEAVEAEIRPVSLAYLPVMTGVDLRVTAWNLAPAEADSRLAQAITTLYSRIGDWIYGEESTDLAEVILARARARNLRLATAESCTGGGIAARLTEIPGSSDVLVGGIIAYDNRVKQDQLGVSADLLAEHGAVSEPVARAMAEGVSRLMGTQLAVAVTGIAGPSGGTPDKPVGLVYLATAIEGVVTASRHVFPGGRSEIRTRAVQAALIRLLKGLGGLPI